MSRPLESPKLPKLPFFAGNLVLLLAAWVIFSQAAKPLAGTPLVALTLCVSLAAMAACVPFLADYTRQQDTALDERQRALEALARTTAETAEQIGIAATGLHTITELAQKNLKSAEQLLPRWQEKSQEFVQRLAEANSAELEALRREINALRTAEVGKLVAAAEKMAQTAAELAKLDAAFRAPRPPTASGPKPVENPPALAPAKADPKPVPATVAAAVPAQPERAPKLVVIAEPVPPAVPALRKNTAPPDADVSPERHANALAAAIAAADAMVMEVPHEELGTISPFPSVTKPTPAPAASASAPSGEIAAPGPKRSKRAKTPPPTEPPPATTVPLADETAPSSEPAAGDSASKATGDPNLSMLDLAIGDDTPLSTNFTYPPFSANPTIAPFAFKAPPPKPPAKAVRTEVPPG